MKLRKDIWEQKQIGEICSVSSGGTPSKANIEYWSDGKISWLRSEACKDEVVKNVEEFISELGLKRSSAKLFKPNTTLIALVGATIGKTAFVPFETTTNQNVSGIYPLDEDRVYHKYLFYACQSFYERNFSRYTGFKMANLSFIKGLEIPLPPLSEQKQIAALFQSIETAMEQVDGQEKNLKSLQKKLVNCLVSTEPVFGNLLNSKNCIPTNMGAIAECDKKYPEHEKEVERFVGLENIEPENFQLQGFGLVANGTTFTKRFANGDVLFGKRRAYLKKVAVADFDGICSGDILVIRAKAKKMLQGLLPYYISADAFINHAVSTSAGSLSPRTKWKDLADFEVSIPDLKTQEKILELFQKLTDTINQLKQQKTTLKHLKQKLLNEILG
jgi:restriction endonuclease S subunit